MLTRRGRISERKLMLFGCACCRRQWHLFDNDACRAAVETTERFVDGLCGEPDLCNARAAVDDLPADFRPHRWAHNIKFAASFTALNDAAASRFGLPCGEYDDIHAQLKSDVAGNVGVALHRPNDQEVELAEEARRSGDWSKVDFSRFQETVDSENAAQCELLRDIVGNPFRLTHAIPVPVTPAVRSLASIIYSSRAFERMPELADSLEQAGCTDADLLAHCRGPGPHVRGCWVVDLILGKS